MLLLPIAGIRPAVHMATMNRPPQFDLLILRSGVPNLVDRLPY
jgi:hypothetical protein